jgi:SAM-dependent methyltransferase
VPVDLREILRCPVCRGAVTGDNDGDGVRCTVCDRRYAASDGILSMLDDDLPGIAEKRAEIVGWVEKAREEEWYEPDDEVDAALPFVCRDLGWQDSVWAGNEQSFQALLDRYVEPGQRVLEVGAAKCWAAQHLLRRGCEYVGTDILDDANIGLGRGAFFARRAGEFARVQADGERLPFADASFDLTFAVAALHHALDLDAMVAEMARVTRPGGLVAGLNEGTRPLARSGDAPGQRAERALGINEHVHTVWAYVAAFTRAGLRIRRIQPAIGEQRTAPGRVAARVPKVGTTLASLAELSLGDYSGVTVYARKPRR